jgi:uncharacterized protein (TIGR02453 family)
MPDFKGLPKDFFVFFNEIAFNNEKAWFEANKPRYKASVVEPLSGFIAAMAPRIAKISKQIVCDPRPNGGSMFRIYRDVRFAKDKKPYKENAGVHFRHAAGKDAHAPGYYVHFAPKEVFFGGGLWMPEPDALAKVRNAIVSKSKDWSKIKGDAGFKAHFKSMEGESLSRPPKGFDPDHVHIEDLKRKSFFVMAKGSEKLALTPKLLDEVEAAARAAKPLMQFLCKALGAPF